MKYYDEQLQKLQTQVARKQQLEAMISELSAQRKPLAEKVQELEKIKIEEQADVDRLEGGGLAAFFYNMIGKKEEHLDKERQEAYAAKVKYDVAARELEAVEDALARYEAELAGLQHCREQYVDVLNDKMRQIKQQGEEAATEILHLEESLADCQTQKKELQEALAAGRSAQETASLALDWLDEAESMSTWDMLGGGLLVDLAKHNDLDAAQDAVERLQMQLRTFKTELADVEISANIQARVDGFLGFADFFFDGIFADWAVHDRICNSMERVRQTRNEIGRVLMQLKTMSDVLDEEIEKHQKELERLVREA